MGLPSTGSTGARGSSGSSGSSSAASSTQQEERTPHLVTLEGYEDGEHYPGPIEFIGTQIAKVSTERPNKLRWTEMRLYQITDGPHAGYYVFGVKGGTIVYHVHDSGCGIGIPTRTQEMPVDAQPCMDCHPTPFKSADRGVLYDLEREPHKATMHPDAQAVLTEINKRISAPSQQLVQIAATRDPQIAAASRAVRRL